MSKLFRFSESLRKNNGKKWSKIWKLLLIKGVKSPRKTKICFFANFVWLAGFFFGIGATNCSGREMLCLPYAEFFLQILASFFLYYFKSLKGSLFGLLTYLRGALVKRWFLKDYIICEQPIIYLFPDPHWGPQLLFVPSSLPFGTDSITEWPLIQRNFSLFFCKTNVSYNNKNPAYRRQSISRQMRIVSPPPRSFKAFF